MPSTTADRRPTLSRGEQEITVPGGLGDTTQSDLPQPDFAFGAIVSAPRRCACCGACSRSTASTP